MGSINIYRIMLDKHDFNKTSIFRFLLIFLFWTTWSATQLNAQTKSVPFEGVPGWAETQSERLNWFQEARFGVFIHWGLYSAAGGVYQGQRYPQHYAEWIQTWGKIPSKQYAKTLRPQFTLKHFDPQKWASLVKKSGAKYMVLTSRHHEGFSLFNSQQPFSLRNDVTGSTNLSPEGRDLYREIIDAFHQQGLKTGAYYSLLDWQHPDAHQAFQLNPNPSGHIPDPQRYKDYMHGQIKELATNYGELDILWADFSSKELEGESWGTERILSDLIKWQPNILINNRFWNGLENKNGDIGTPEKYVPPTGINGTNWEVNHTMNESYGYSVHDNNWKSFPQIMRLLVETVSKGGNFLLNVGPDGHGEIPQQAVTILEQVGNWMASNGEAIYGTQASPFRKLQWGYCTVKKDKLYLHVFDVPKQGIIHVPLRNKVKYITDLAMGSSPQKYTQGESGIEVVVSPSEDAKGPRVLVMQVEGALEIMEPVFQPLADGSIELQADDAELHAELGLTIKGATTHDAKRPTTLTKWSSTADSASWNVKVQRPGAYTVMIEYLPSALQGGTIVFSTGKQELSHTFKLEDGKSFQKVSLGMLEIPQEYIGHPSVRFALKASSIAADGLPEIGPLTLVPIEN